MQTFFEEQSLHMHRLIEPLFYRLREFVSLIIEENCTMRVLLKAIVNVLEDGIGELQLAHVNPLQDLSIVKSVKNDNFLKSDWSVSVSVNCLSLLSDPIRYNSCGYTRVQLRF